MKTTIHIIFNQWLRLNLNVILKGNGDEMCKLLKRENVFLTGTISTEGLIDVIYPGA